MPFTSGAKAALSRAIVVAKRGPARRVTAVHLLVGLLDGDRTDPASDVLTELGVTG
ncbi:hypothetical protein OIE67_53490 [Nonomuraea fuscirosea]|uniref:hypothetical protein n=1 Tax=Nonomuraea fuscirosea TaxID=1291556 RepID=UPI002DD8B6CC|nr:hypothetical protein [Nonomuraea fuscirosea]WSA52729.1 hypothetical protein OIE67_53490 [Nonomuraea fuscirosea]